MTNNKKRTIQANEEIGAKLAEIRKENCQLSNTIKDLEYENQKLKDNVNECNKFMDQSNKIDDLERENRQLKNDIDYLKFEKLLKHKLSGQNLN